MLKNVLPPFYGSQCILYRHRDNPLYDMTSATVKSRDSSYVTSPAARKPRRLRTLVALSIVLATAAVVMTTIAVGTLFASTCHW